MEDLTAENVEGLVQELEEAQWARRPQSRMALFVDISMGAIGGVIVAFVLLTPAGLLELTEAEPSAFLFLAAALAGARVGAAIGWPRGLFHREERLGWGQGLGLVAAILGGVFLAILSCFLAVFPGC